MYNLNLAIYYAKIIVKGKKENDIVKVEPYLHANAILWGMGTALASLPLTLFNPVGWDCWISAEPLGCKETWHLEEGEVTTCERGDNGSICQWAFYLWIVIIFVSLMEYWIYATVRKQEKSTKVH
eukprot:scaffold132034_cov42-Cyclotella_meneghiniana.AAC.2